MSTTFMKVQDVADELGVSKSYAYKIVQMLWVQKMNSIRNRATEVVNANLIYA